jgi:hypothetical protein
MSLTLFGSLTPSARAADEPAQEEATSDDNSDDDGEQDEAQEESEVEAELVDDATDLQVEVELVADIQEPQVEAALADDTDPKVELEFVAEPRNIDMSVDTSELIERAVAEAVKKALAQVDVARKKEIDKATRKVNLELKKVHQQHLQLEKEARDKALVARKKATMQAAEAQKLQQKLQGILLRQQVELKNKADEEVKLAKARRKEQAEVKVLDRAILQQANDRRFEELAVMVKELSLQVKQLSNDLNDLRKETSERQNKDDDGERSF